MVDAATRRLDGATIVGRDAELAALEAFARADPVGGTLVLVGGPGFGKTTLWEAGLRAARVRGLRVLSARPGDTEAELSFSGLIDLLDGVDVCRLAGLPAPQVRALQLALLQLEVPGATAEPQAIA